MLLTTKYKVIMTLFYVISGETSWEKTPILSWFYRKLGPFYRKLNFDNLYRPKSQKVRKCSNTTKTKEMYLTSNFYIKSVTYVKTTPVAETIVKFCEIAHFSLKTTSFYEKLPLFTENYPPFIKNFGPPPYRKLKPLISAFIENSIFGNNRDPCPTVHDSLL